MGKRTKIRLVVPLNPNLPRPRFSDAIGSALAQDFQIHSNMLFSVVRTASTPMTAAAIASAVSKVLTAGRAAMGAAAARGAALGAGRADAGAAAPARGAAGAAAGAAAP